ncbi:MAG: 30S ribosomal protein S4 [Patescibacteria group bacterium]
MDKCRECRKYQTKLFLKGQRCTTPKCSVTRRNYKPGIFGPKKTSSRKSEYGLQLLEKQKAKTEYGLRERQFANLFNKAASSRFSTQEELLSLLESRLDNVVYRLGWALSRRQARQIVSHRKIKINNSVVNIPSRILKANDIISTVEKEIKPVTDIKLPKWLKLDLKNNQAQFLGKPNRGDIESDLDEQLIVEFYSR